MALLMVVQGNPVARVISASSSRLKAAPRKKLSDVPMSETALTPSSLSATAFSTTESMTSR